MTLFQKYFLYFIFTYFLFHSCFCFDSNLKRELIKSLAISKIKDFNFLTQTSILSNVSPECINDIKYIRTGLYNFEFWIIPLLDSNFKIPGSFVNSAMKSTGNMQSCLLIGDISHYTYRSKHCIIEIPVKNFLNISLSDFWIAKFQDPSIMFGICVPASCSSNDIEYITNWYLNKLKINSHINVNDELCHTIEKESWRIKDKIALFFFLSIGLLVLISTYYDMKTADSANRIETYTTFSFYSNAINLMNGEISNLDSLEQNIQCIAGLRFLAVVWIIIARRYIILLKKPIFNLISSLYKFEVPLMHSVFFSSHLATDIFLFTSGLLASLKLIKTYKLTGHLNYKIIYFQRFLRSAPLFFALIIFSSTIFRYFGNGPFWHKEVSDIEKNCENNWPLNFLYINNFFNTDNMCLSESWYLSLDAQLYLFTPILLNFLFDSQFHATILVVILLITGPVLTVFISLLYKLNISLYNLNFAGLDKIFDVFLIKPYTTYTSWLIGIFLGFILNKKQNPKKKINSILFRVYWIVALSCILGAIGFIHPFLQDTNIPNNFESALYLSCVKPIFTFGIALVVILCAHDKEGIINMFLSSNLMRILNRLVYSMYMLHILFEYIHQSAIWGPFYLSMTNEFFEISSSILLLLIPASFFYIIFVAPFSKIEHYIIPKLFRNGHNYFSSTTSMKISHL